MKPHSISINEARRVVSEYLKQDENEWKAKKQPGGGYSGTTAAILEHTNGGFAIVSKFGNYYHIVFIMPDGFITTAGEEYV